jgi:hypothetical protein
MFAIMILLAGASVALKQAEVALNYPILGTFAAYFVMGAAGIMTIIIGIRLIIGYKKQDDT